MDDKHPQIKILTLNMMHGRNAKNSVLPFFLSRKRARNNIKNIAALINHHQPDIVMLQEVDNFSLFNGRFDHLKELEKQTNFSFTYYGSEVNWGFGKVTAMNTGNALLSRYPLHNQRLYVFAHSFPTERKGFIVADVQLPSKTITVASIHLVWKDWLHKNARLKQTKKIIDVLSKNNHPLILAGDFNCELVGKIQEKTLLLLIRELNLHTHHPHAEDLFTHPSYNPSVRIDWILSSQEITFVDYTIIPDLISDHLAISSTLFLPV